MNGSQYIAEFLKRKELDKIFLVTGGAVAFIVDAIGQKNYSKLYCFQHEQSASMAADTTWRCSDGKKMGVSMATSGPGAVNLLSGSCVGKFSGYGSINLQLINVSSSLYEYKLEVSID